MKAKINIRDFLEDYAAYGSLTVQRYGGRFEDR
jgi:hypothetical protein